MRGIRGCSHCTVTGVYLQKSRGHPTPAVTWPITPKRDAAECTGMHFYHWGALTGFIGLVEAGFYTGEGGK